MSPFLTLFNPLISLKHNIIQSQTSYHSHHIKHYLSPINNIHKEYLIEIVHFIHLFIHTIHHSHQDSTLHIYIISIINTLLHYYNKHTLSHQHININTQFSFHIPYHTIEQLIQKRFDLFNNISTHLRELFSHQTIQNEDIEHNDAPQGRRKEMEYENRNKMVDIEDDREYHAKRIQYIEKKCVLMEIFLERLHSLLTIQRDTDGRTKIVPYSLERGIKDYFSIRYLG